MQEPGGVKESTITVAVRIRPLSAEEAQYVRHDGGGERGEYEVDTDGGNKENIEGRRSHGEAGYLGMKGRNRRVTPKYAGPFAIKKILDVVDDRMLIFDPKPSSLEDVDMATHFSLGSSSKRSLSGRGIGNHNKRHKEHKFIFDQLFDENSTQHEIYENTTKPAIEAVLDGYNSTIFAYGATGCGKTYTITGTPENPGIIFLALGELFAKIESQEDRDIAIQVSYLEIYNETIKDLLNIETSPKKLTILENEHKEIIVSNLTKMDTQNVEDVMDVIIRGNCNRTVSATEANLTSSRSHAVLQVYITQNPHVSDIYEKSTRSVLSIIDLAGSERASSTKNKGVRLNEGANINKSLLALGNCINALCDTRRSPHIPYRDSKLTRLLKFSLGGNCKTVMIVCVSPSSRHYDETLNALKFANRAKEIKTKVARNRTTVMKHVGSYMKIISDQKRKIYELETLMDSTVNREVLKFIEKRNNIAEEIKTMIGRLWNNLKKCEHLKSEKILAVTKRKMLLVYNKQLTDFLQGLCKFDVENKMNPLKNNLIELLENLKSQMISLESFYNQRTKLDTILIETSESFLKKLQESECWTASDEELYLKEIEYLKSEVEKQIFYESSILFDSWILENDNVGNLHSIPTILAQYLCIIEDVANNIETIESARMKCFQLSDDLIESCNQQLTANFEIDHEGQKEYNINNKKRKKSGTGNIPTTTNTSESSFVRKGNRINSINNKLMRINLNSDKELSADHYDHRYSHMDSLSEVESSLILENETKPSRVSSAVRASSQSIFLQSESTPQKDSVIDNINDYGSPAMIQRLSDQNFQIGTRDIIHEEIAECDESNSSVIIRRDTNRDLQISPLVSPTRSRTASNRNERLTSKKLIASPRITSPHRLAAINTDNNFQLKLQNSTAGFQTFSENTVPLKEDINMNETSIIEGRIGVDEL